MEGDAVIDAAALQEGVAGGIEEGAAVGDEVEVLVIAATVDEAEGGEQAHPGVVAVFEHLLAGEGGGGAELIV